MTDEELIIQTHLDVNQAIVNRDFDWLEDFYPEGFKVRHTGGYYQSKEDWLDSLRNGTFEYFDYNLTESKVIMKSPTEAILSFRANTDARIYGFRKRWRMQFDTPFRKIGGVWKPWY